DVAELCAEFLSDALRDGPRGEPPGLGVADLPLPAAPELERDLRDLRRLARSGLAGDDHDLVVADRCGDVLPASRDGQLGRVDDLGDVDGRPPGGGRLELCGRHALRPLPALRAAAPALPAASGAALARAAAVAVGHRGGGRLATHNPLFSQARQGQFAGAPPGAVTWGHGYPSPCRDPPDRPTLSTPGDGHPGRRGRYGGQRDGRPGEGRQVGMSDALIALCENRIAGLSRARQAFEQTAAPEQVGWLVGGLRGAAVGWDEVVERGPEGDPV